MQKIKKFLSANFDSYIVLIGFVFLLILINRSFPYFLYGPFGFGYDVGIYKNSFEATVSISDIFQSQIAIFPSFLAFVFNLVHFPMDFLLYHFYILFSVFVAVALYLLAKECFDKRVAFVTVAIFSVSYVEILASQFYLYKAVLGAIFLLLAFYTLIKKSNWFNFFLVVVAFTQLPQLLILLVAVSISSIFDWKKNKKFYIRSLMFFSSAFVILLLFNFNHLANAFRVVIFSLQDVETFDSHLGGLFLSLAAFWHRAALILVVGGIGLFMSVRRGVKKILPLQVAVCFLILVVFFKLFFENRFIVELDLLLLPFVAYGALYFFDSIFHKKKLVDAIAASLVAFSLVFLSYWYYQTTFPALTEHEAWALEIIKSKPDSKYIMVTDTFYAPWAHGFSGKDTLAAGIFESVWNFEQWVKYHAATDVEKAFEHLEISAKYGKYYLFMGRRQLHPALEEYSEKIKKIFDVSGAVIYEVDA